MAGTTTGYRGDDDIARSTVNIHAKANNGIISGYLQAGDNSYQPPPLPLSPSMFTTLYAWQRIGACVHCGNPIYEKRTTPDDIPEVHRSCGCAKHIPFAMSSREQSS